jgi:hypothetical protein
VVDEDTPNGLRGEREEVRAILDGGLAFVGELQPSLVHEIGRLPRMRASFATHRPRGESPQLRVEQRQEPIPGRTVASPQLGQQRADVGRFLHGESPPAPQEAPAGSARG